MHRCSYEHNVYVSYFVRMHQAGRCKIISFVRLFVWFEHRPTCRDRLEELLDRHREEGTKMHKMGIAQTDRGCSLYFLCLSVCI